MYTLWHRNALCSPCHVSSLDTGEDYISQLLMLSDRPMWLSSCLWECEERKHIDWSLGNLQQSHLNLGNRDSYRNRLARWKEIGCLSHLAWPGLWRKEKSTRLYCFKRPKCQGFFVTATFTRLSWNIIHTPTNAQTPKK